ncbi:sensor domain-containing diguanylate cyclase [Lysobacter sp. TY2-98]|uniref:sensor domain-containing diguanylate cyclase n=1 Tax=Lysobacter sp. TY2-98 TaxID=2290922 RepID=UPI0021008C19|nr:sensor domain-containing diguanylate cyclase [Lysobacter sp. TY2-98]
MDVSAAYERIFGYTCAEVLGRRMIDLVHPDDREATLAAAQRVMGGTMQRHFRNRYVRKDGRSVDVQWSARWLPDYGVRVAIGREVTDLRRAEVELEHLARHDPLTGLPNRYHLQRELRLALERAAETGTGLAVLYIDLDGFKAANDRAGHAAGDLVLRDVAQRLQQALRQGDLLARVGGDEFVAMLPGCRDSVAAGLVADTLRARLQTPFELTEGQIDLDASIGIACFPGNGATVEALLASADSAMYAIKRTRPHHAAEYRSGVPLPG